MKKIKKRNLVIQLLFVGLLLLFNISCEKEKSPPKVTTAEITEISQVSAVGGGNVTDDGGSEILARGICYSTSPEPTMVDNDATNDGIGTGEFISEMANLSFGTTYYVKAFAVNYEGIVYGEEVSFTTENPEGVDCPADIWNGDLSAQDEIWSDYAPTYCIGEKNGDCQLLNITLDFWGYGSESEVVFQLQLEPLDLETYEGNVTLLQDALTTAEGSDITFHKGAAGVYKPLSKELILEVKWSGYDSTESYKWIIIPL